MKYVKEVKLKQIIFKIKAMIERVNNYVDLIVKKTIEHYKKAIEEIIANLMNTFLEIKDKAYYSIEFLYSYTRDQVDSLKDQVMKDYETIVEDINNKIYKLQCIFTSIEYAMRKNYKELFEKHEFKEFREACVNEYNTMYRKSLDMNYYEDFSTSEFYELAKCTLQKNIEKGEKNNSDFFYIKRTYDELIRIASEMKCLAQARDASSNIKYYNKDMTKFEQVLLEFMDKHKQKLVRVRVFNSLNFLA